MKGPFKSYIKFLPFILVGVSTYSSNLTKTEKKLVGLWQGKAGVMPGDTMEDEILYLKNRAFYEIITYSNEKTKASDNGGWQVKGNYLLYNNGLDSNLLVSINENSYCMVREGCEMARNIVLSMHKNSDRTRKLTFKKLDSNNIPKFMHRYKKLNRKFKKHM